ncbi:MAG: hypothetical protein COB78_01520 [Hyphomicrobiales bacterium]|nr:MAG: hypothetical protein COB78_01520 [Hyphomicrobiales bacterium]
MPRMSKLEKIVLVVGCSLPDRMASATRGIGLEKLFQSIGFDVVIVGKLENGLCHERGASGAIIEGGRCFDIRKPFLGWEGRKVIRNLLRILGTQLRMCVLTRWVGNVIFTLRYLCNLVTARNEIILPWVIDAIDLKWQSFVGKGEEVNDTIRFLGRIPHAEALDLMRSSDFLVFFRPDNSVSNASFATKYIEAATLAIPVTTNDTSDLGLYLKDRHNGFLTPDISDVLQRAVMFTPKERVHMKPICASNSPFDIPHWQKTASDFISVLRRSA